MQVNTHIFLIWPLVIALSLGVGCQNQPVPNTSSTEEAQVQPPTPALRQKEQDFEAMKAKLVHESRVRHMGTDYANKQKFKTQADPPAGRYWYPETLRTQSNVEPWEENNPPLINGEYRAQIPFWLSEIPFKDTNQEDLESGYQYERPLGYFWEGGRGAQNPVALFKNQESDTALLGSNVDGSGSFLTEGTLSYELRNGSNQVVATGNWGAGNLGPINLTPLLPPLLTQTNMRLSLFLSKPESATDKRLGLSRPLYVVNAYSRARQFYEFALKTDTRYISPSNQLDSYPDSVQLDIDFDPIVDNYPGGYSITTTWAELYRVVNGNWEYIEDLPAPEIDANGQDSHLTWSGQSRTGQNYPDGEYIISVISLDWDDYEKVVISNGGVVPSPTPSPSPSASPPPGGLPEAKLSDLRKDYLDAYNDDIVARAQKVKRKLDWLVQVNQQKLAQLEQEGTGFATQMLDSSSINYEEQFQVAQRIDNSNRLLRVNNTLANTSGCFNYYTFVAQPKIPQRPRSGNEDQQLVIKLLNSFSDTKGVTAKGKIIDKNTNAPPLNIRDLYGLIIPNNSSKIELSEVRATYSPNTGEIFYFTPYGKYFLTEIYKNDPGSSIKTQLRLMEGSTVKVRSNVVPLTYTWPAGPGEDINKLPIPMYKYHLTESTRIAINNIRNFIMTKNTVKETFSKNNGFYSNICYDKTLGYSGIMKYNSKGIINLGNQAFAGQDFTTKVIIHESSHRLFWLNQSIKNSFTNIADEEYGAERIARDLANDLGYTSENKEMNKNSELYLAARTTDPNPAQIKLLNELKQKKAGLTEYRRLKSTNNKVANNVESKIYLSSNFNDNLCSK